MGSEATHRGFKSPSPRISLFFNASRAGSCEAGEIAINFDGQEGHEVCLAVFGWLKLFGEHEPEEASIKKF
jgi:hypothetical protein